MKWHRFHATADEATQPDAKLQFFTPEKVGPNQSLTPEGFLICLNVPVARTGTQEYAPGEVPDELFGNQKKVTVTREEKDVFADRFIQSLNGKPLANDHPSEEITPANWRQYSVGTATNVRRGTGAEQDFLIADLVICDEETIQDIRDGKREVSCGYRALYEPLGDGRARQYDFIGNHIALVDAARCGHRCAIQDHHHSLTGDCAMTTKKVTRDSLYQRLKKAIRANDAEGEEEAMRELEEAEGGGERDVHIHLESGAAAGPGEMIKTPTFEDECRERFGKMEDAMTGMVSRFDEAFPPKKAAEDSDEDDPDKKKDKTEDDDLDPMLDEVPEEKKSEAKDAMGKPTADSAYFGDSVNETVSLAEILSPGVGARSTFDSKAKPKVTFDAICALRRSALEAGVADTNTKGIIESVNGGPLKLAGMRCNDVRTVFRAAASLKRARNNDAHRRHAADVSFHEQGNTRKPARSVDNLVKYAAEYYKKA